MKYRIKQVGDSFYPQGQFLWFFWSCYGDDIKRDFDSLEGARVFLDRLSAPVDSTTIIHNYP